MGDDMRDMINTLIKGSRVAILNTDGKINRYGTGWAQIDGIWYSNMLWRYASCNYYDAWDEWDGYYNNYKSYKPNAVKPTNTNTPPSIDKLEPLSSGEVIKITDSKTAYINSTDGSYLLDAKTGKLYGHYKGALYTTRYAVCDTYNCPMCEYNCPIKSGGA
jgi:hypothetical protein